MTIRSSIRVSTLFALIVMVSVALFPSFNQNNVFAQGGIYDGIQGLRLSVSPDSTISDGGTVALVAWVSQGSDIDWYWDFGDGQTYFSSGTGRFNDITHTYNLTDPTRDQEFTISVRAKNAKNQMTASVEILVKIKAPTNLSVSHSPTQPSVGEEVTFTATLDDPAGVTYTWVFGDGTSEVTTSPTVMHEYKDSRPYNYSVTASNSSGRSPATGGTIDVSDARITFCNINVSGASEVDNSLTFSAQNDGSSVSYTWRFSDEARERNNQSVTRSYGRAGSYYVDLICSNNTNSITAARRTINIIDTPITNLRIMNTAPVETPQKAEESVLFSAHSDGTSILYTWDFGDGNSMVTLDSTVAHTYAAEGRYVASVIASNSGGFRMIEAPVHIRNKESEVPSVQNLRITYRLANTEFRNYLTAGDAVILTVEPVAQPPAGDSSDRTILSHEATDIDWSVSGAITNAKIRSMGGIQKIPEAGTASIVVVYDEPGRYAEQVTIYHTVADVKFVYAVVDRIIQIGSEQRMPFIAR